MREVRWCEGLDGVRVVQVQMRWCEGGAGAGEMV